MPPEPELSHAQIASDGQDVVAAVNGLAGLVADVDDLDDVLARIAGLAVESVPGADGAAVTVVRAGTDAGAGRPVVLAWAVTAPIVREIDHLQYDICQEGPCLTAMQNRRAVISGSLGNDPRWPRFGARVALRASLSAWTAPANPPRGDCASIASAAIRQSSATLSNPLRARSRVERAACSRQTR